MNQSEILLALTSDPEQMARNILRIVHFIGLALGLGAAMLLDLMILQYLPGRVISKQNCEFITFCSDIVAAGLRLLWVTGLGFLVFYWTYDPINLINGKIWAKMIIVLILTINGFFIHRTVLPFLRSQIGKTMLHGATRKQQHLLVSAGSISTVSWFGPLFIANMPQLNFQVPMIQILAVYAFVLTAVFTVVHLALHAAAGQSKINQPSYQVEYKFSRKT
jgi:hypothetical protein